MAYATLEASPGYTSKHAGAELEVVLIDENDPGNEVSGAVTGANVSYDLEAVPIEEAGNEIVSSIVQGRGNVSVNLNAFWTPEWGDKLPDLTNFLGKSYTVVCQIGPNWPNAGEVMDVVTGCVLQRLNKAHGARGARTMDMSFMGTEGINGKNWSLQAGG